MEYTSLHDYLDCVFSDNSNPNESEIVSAKKQYWKIYNTALKKRQRRFYKEFSVRFSKQEFGQIKNALRKGQAVSGFIREAVLFYLDENPEPVISIDIARILQQLFLISQLLEDVLDIENMDVNYKKELDNLHRKITTLESLIEDYDHKK